MNLYPGGARLGEATSQGDRDYLEDVCRAIEIGNDEWLLMLADGMGGHVGGEVAATTAVEAFAEHFSSNAQAENLEEAFLHALEFANEAIARRQVEEPQLEGMGCTLVAALVIERRVYWISVGDSPMWIVGPERMRRINADHSMGALLDQLLANGKITQEDAHEGDRNVLRSALDGGEIKHIDVSVNGEEIFENERLLIASDGLQTLNEEEIQSIAGKEGDARQHAQELIDEALALSKPNQDNIAVLLLNPPGIGSTLPTTIPVPTAEASRLSASPPTRTDQINNRTPQVALSHPAGSSGLGVPKRGISLGLKALLGAAALLLAAAISWQLVRDCCAERASPEPSPPPDAYSSKSGATERQATEAELPEEAGLAPGSTVTMGDEFAPAKTPTRVVPAELEPRNEENPSQTSERASPQSQDATTDADLSSAPADDAAPEQPNPGDQDGDAGIN